LRKNWAAEDCRGCGECKQFRQLHPSSHT
jgi:hypothetical protein